MKQGVKTGLEAEEAMSSGLIGVTALIKVWRVGKAVIKRIRGEGKEDVAKILRETGDAPKRAMEGRKVGHTFSKHGARNTEQLLREAAGSGRPVGQWVDDAAAEEFIAAHLDQLKNGAQTLDLPEGLGRIVHPDGTFSTATKVRLVPSGNGVKTAYPLLD